MVTLTRLEALQRGPNFQRLAVQSFIAVEMAAPALLVVAINTPPSPRRLKKLSHHR